MLLIFLKGHMWQYVAFLILQILIWTRSTIEVRHVFSVEVPQFARSRPLQNLVLENNKGATGRQPPRARHTTRAMQNRRWRISNDFAQVKEPRHSENNKVAENMYTSIVARVFPQSKVYKIKYYFYIEGTKLPKLTTTCHNMIISFVPPP